jgi:hypothetical protein
MSDIGYLSCVSADAAELRMLGKGVALRHRTARRNFNSWKNAHLARAHSQWAKAAKLEDRLTLY